MSPEKRISSNFYTVPLKRASEQTEPFHYPKRPAPLMSLGKAATGVKWGISRHKQWAQNLPGFFSEITGSTYFTDLAVFVFRDSRIPDEHAQSGIEALAFLLKERFSPELSAFWIDKMKKEQILTRHLSAPSCDARESIVPNPAGHARPAERKTVEELESYVQHLERILQRHGIDY